MTVRDVAGLDVVRVLIELEGMTLGEKMFKQACDLTGETVFEVRDATPKNAQR